LLQQVSVTTFLREEIEMILDWLTVVGIVLALAAAFGIAAVALAGRRSKRAGGKALPPRFRALAAGNVHEYLEHSPPAELPRRRASDGIAGT
jgi:hypothetical protein